MLTEEEAREKWCPMARASAAGGPVEGNHACNRWAADGPGGQNAMNPPDAHCIASACMWWQWGERERETYRLRIGATEVDGVPVVRGGTIRVVGGVKWRYLHTDIDADGEFELLHRAPADDKPKAGYCGAAGKPEVA